ncbi:hypothetical protein ATL41_1947 [Flavimobilis soli]|uniref:Uncharacterized protein n=1 Tax=Flavimobilis soli TaxID=442709 RepID=A0A2A9EE49_9MICO|nr:DUF6518 family protein [Flavimobilis soli]PFG37194.1 hypothetical protein ATL41_1947 [Flavimobilis soli]
MTATLLSPATTARRGALPVVFVLAASWSLGFATFHAQGWLPEALAPFANSASGWTLLTACLVAIARPTAKAGAALGAASFVLLVLGYAAAADVADLYYSPVRFGLIGLAVGPFVGAAASSLRRGGRGAGAATALLSGIGLGEAFYGVTEVAGTTGLTYWLAAGVGALALLGGMFATRLRSRDARIVAGVGAVIVAAAFVVAYRSLGGA